MNCPICHRRMTKFVDGWRCMNVKAPEHNQTTREGVGKKGGNVGRKPKKGK